MHFSRIGFRLASAAAVLVAASPLGAQAWAYPSFQGPRIAAREFNFVVSDGGNGAGTGLVFQWREGMGGRTQLSLDAGYAEPEYGPQSSDGFFLVGGQFGRQLVSASADMPIDVMLTAGLNIAIGDPFNLVRVPVGVAAGHRFRLEKGMAITPYGHLRLSYDRISSNGFSDSEMNPNFDLGGSFEFNPRFAVRLSATLGDDDAFGASLAWTPGRRSPSQPTRQPTRR